MRKLAVVWTIAGLLAGTAFCLAAETKQKPRAPEKKSAAKESEATGATQAYLGIGIAALPPSLTSHLPELISSGQGILIAQVVDKSPAEKAGLKMHDIVLAVGDKKVRSPEQFVKMIHTDKPGQEVVLHIVRAGKAEEIKVTLGEAKVAEMPRLRRVLRPFLGQRSERPAVTDEEAEARWATFDSMTLTRLDKNRFRAEIKYRDDEGKVDTHTFEGTREQLRKAIESETDMPSIEQGHLLRMLGMSKEGLESGPTIFMRPGGEVIWDFEGMQR